MARNLIESQNAILAAQDSTAAWSYNQQSLVIHKIAQDCQFSANIPRQNLKQLGAEDFVSQDFYRQPDANLTISYIPEPNCSNEVRGRFINASGGWVSEFQNMFNSPEGSDSNNFYVLIAKNQEDDFLDEVEFYAANNFSGLDAIAFGNCFPVSYNLTYGVGGQGIPRVTTEYICSNVVFENITGNGTAMASPAINLTGQNNDGAGRIGFDFVRDLSSDLLEKTPPIVNPTNTNSSITLENLQVGGQTIVGSQFIQSVNMSVQLPRVSNYGLGGDYPYGRKPQFPANGTFSVSSLVSGLESGSITGVLSNDENYSFQLVLDASGKKMIYEIQDAKLESYNYSMAVNGGMSFDASFNFAVTPTTGLRLSGTYY
jgi:hypothetical protein